VFIVVKHLVLNGAIIMYVCLVERKGQCEGKGVEGGMKVVNIPCSCTYRVGTALTPNGHCSQIKHNLNKEGISVQLGQALLLSHLN